MNLKELNASLVWKHFETLCTIPHPSYHEAALIQHIEKFAHQLELETEIDEAGNLLVRKPATLAEHSGKSIVLQAHVDMVPQKNADKDHDFIKDSIELVVEDSWLRANQTTLGADNGIGVAAMMALLETDTLRHGSIECLFTINEESGMDGAFGLKSDWLTADVMLNLDSEEEGEVFIGCAGGVDVVFEKVFPTERKDEGSYVEIKLSGLKGGHSGLDIHLGRANANVELVKVVQEVTERVSGQLLRFAGGNLLNAIPREAEAVVWIPNGKDTLLEELLQELSEGLTKTYQVTDSAIQLEYYKTEQGGACLQEGMQQEVCSCILDCPQGVLSYAPDMPGVVQTSNNVSIIQIENGRIQVKMLLRSASDCEREAFKEDLTASFSVLGAKPVFAGEYPGWMPRPDSSLLLQAKNLFNDMYGKYPEVKVIHAGLECGIIGAKYPDMDILSFGPTIKFPHSPDEKVEIASVDRFWKYLIALVEEIGKGDSK